jgi:hypothetical protein
MQEADMTRFGGILALFAMVGGCSAVDVGPELKIMAEAATGTSGRVLAIVNADPEGERQQRLDNASAAKPAEPWAFPSGCGPVPQAIDAPEACVLKRGKAWDQAVQADAIRRKLAVISAYVEALSDMASADNDAALIAAYSTALTAIGDLATAAEIASLQDTVKALKGSQAATGQVVTFLLANRRAHLLKKTVLRSRDHFNDVVQEIIDGLMNETTEDDTLTEQYLSLDAIMNEAVKAGARGDTAAYRDALDRADSAYGQYMEARNRSVFAPLAGLAATHEALARRLQRPATIQEIQTFTRALADLRLSLK